MEFTCATPLAHVVLVWDPESLRGYAHLSTRPEGGQQSVLRFNATAYLNDTQVVCTALSGSGHGLHPVENSSAILLVQGESFGIRII